MKLKKIIKFSFFLFLFSYLLIYKIPSYCLAAKPLTPYYFNLNPNPATSGSGATFSWASSVGATSYTIYDSDSGLYLNMGNTTSHYNSSMPAAGSYYARIYACNSSGCSNSRYLSYTIQAATQFLPYFLKWW